MLLLRLLSYTTTGALPYNQRSTYAAVIIYSTYQIVLPVWYHSSSFGYQWVSREFFSRWRVVDRYRVKTQSHLSLVVQIFDGWEVRDSTVRGDFTHSQIARGDFKSPRGDKYCSWKKFLWSLCFLTNSNREARETIRQKFPVVKPFEQISNTTYS